MNNEQINAAIDAALGNPKGCPRCDCPGCAYNKGVNYCNDLNAMHEAEAILTEHQLYRMARNIERNDEHWYFRATARKRAEAFLRTLGKWEEVQG